MKFNITLAHPSRDHWISQAKTGYELRMAGFTKLRWKMGTGRKNGDSLHKWACEGDQESVLILKLSSDVEKIEEIKEEIIS